MKVTVSSQGKFHAFRLATQLARRGALERILTTDPRVFLEPGIPFLRARAFPLSEVVSRLPLRFAATRDLLPWYRLKHRIHDRWAASMLGRPDVVVAWSGAARHVLETARRRGIVSIVERGSAHIAVQDEILRTESARHGLSEGVAPEDVQTELVEYELADYIMVPSSFARRTFLERGFAPEKILQVAYGADVTAYSPAERTDDVFRIVFAGQVSLQKGIPYLLDAVQKLKLPRSEVVLAGPIGPEMRPILKKYDGLYRAVGPLDRASLAKLYQQASVFVLPSIQDGFGMVILEALASGVPVVATSNTGAEDAYRNGDAGFIVPAMDADALAAALERLYREPELRKEMATRAHRNARAWTWEDYGDAAIATYEKLLRSRASRPR